MGDNPLTSYDLSYAVLQYNLSFAGLRDNICNHSELMKTLNLSYNQLGGANEAELMALFAAIPGSVSEITLSFNRLKGLSKTAWQAIYDNLPANLILFDLSDNALHEVSDEVFHFIISQLPKQIRLLNLSSNQLGLRSMASLTAALAKIPPQVSTLILDDNDFSHQSNQEIIALVNAIPSHVTHIVLSNMGKPVSELRALASALTQKYGNTRCILLDIELTAIREAVSRAAKNYQSWYQGTGSVCYRKKNGYFTWFRHGKYGQARAQDIAVAVSQANTVEAAQMVVLNFLQDPSTRYHVHSFASFLLDELRIIPSSPWTMISFNSNTQRYSR